MTGPGGRDGYVPGDGLTRAERRRQSEQDGRRRQSEQDARRTPSEQDARRTRSEQDARRAKGDRSERATPSHDRAADMARAATAMARSRRMPRRLEPVPRRRVRRATTPKDKSRPLYARMLRLTHLRPGGLACFLLFEGVIGLAVLLSLAELVNWFSVIVLPAVVAGIVKINDIIASAFARADAVRRKRGPVRPPRVRGVAKVRGIASVLPIMPRPRDTSDGMAPETGHTSGGLTPQAGRDTSGDIAPRTDRDTSDGMAPRTDRDTSDDIAPETEEDMQATRKLATRSSTSSGGRRRQSNQRRFPMEMRRAEPPPRQW